MYTLQQLGWLEAFNQPFREYRDAGFLPGRISNEQRGHYYLLSEQGELRAEASGRVLYASTSSSGLPKVGDWVAYQPFNDAEAIIHAVLPRSSAISRKDPEETDEQIIAANVDIMLILQGLDGDFNPRRLERYIVTAKAAGVEPVVLLNKADLRGDKAGIHNALKEIVQPEHIVFLSALHDASFDRILSLVPEGRTAVLTGSSGAGKSTLINRLLGKEAQTTNAVREDDSRGRHTTTSRTMFVLPEAGIVIDTPGMRELALWTDSENLEPAFQDIVQLISECRFFDCTHSNEPGCAIRAALTDGRLDASRLRSYEKLKRELAYLNSTDSYLRQKNEFFKTHIARYRKELKGKRE